MHIRQNEGKNWYISWECRKNEFSIVYNSLILVFALESEQSDFPNVFYNIFHIYTCIYIYNIYVYMYILLRIKDNHYL